MGIWTTKEYRQTTSGDWKCYCGHGLFEHYPSLKHCSYIDCHCRNSRYPYVRRPAAWRRKLFTL